MYVKDAVLAGPPIRVDGERAAGTRLAVSSGQHNKWGFVCYGIQIAVGVFAWLFIRPTIDRQTSSLAERLLDIDDLLCKFSHID